MDYIADALLGLGALGAAIYCFVLSRRLRKFNNLRNGMGGAVAVLSAQVDDMTKMLEHAQAAAETSASQLADLTARAETSARKLELMMASLHDLPESHSTAEHASEFRHTAHTETEDDGSALFFSSNRNLEAAE